MERSLKECASPLPDFDLHVVNDGSRDATGQILTQLGVVTTTHLCNLGYGRAIQTALTYALRRDYDVLITLDADGQHYPEQVGPQQIYDTTSEWTIIRRSAFEPLARWHFIDFHAEAVVYLPRLGYRIGEYPITVSENAKLKRVAQELAMLQERIGEGESE